MRLNNAQLIGLPAITQTGDLLGQVVGFEFDADQHVITTYFIGPGKLIERIFGTVRNTQPLAVAASQIISIDNEKMLVHNSSVPTQIEGRTTLPSLASTQPIAQSFELKSERAIS